MAGETVVVDSGEKRLNELGYKQELRREMVSQISTPPFFYLFGPRVRVCCWEAADAAIRFDETCCRSTKIAPYKCFLFFLEK